MGLLPVLLTALALLGSAGESCRRCDSTGLAPCKEHPKGTDELETNVLFCSEVAGCEPCGGTGWVDCKHCENEPAGVAWRARCEGVTAALERHAAIDETMGRPVRKAESEHFVVVWEMRGMKVGKVRKDEHEMLHLTVDRLEALYADYCEVFGVEDDEFQKKSRVFVWYLPEEHRKASVAFCGFFAPSGAKLMGIDPNYSVCGNTQFFKGDEQLHRNLVHCVVHLLFSHQSPSQWIGNLNGGWADEGLAHWFEDRYWDVCDNYCYEEQNTRFSFNRGRFKVDLRKLVEADEAPSVAQVLQRNTDNLEPAEHAVAMGLVDYLVGVDAGKFAGLGRRLRAKGGVREG